MKQYVIVDIDGTIADNTERQNEFLVGKDKISQKDWDGFFDDVATSNDKPYHDIIQLVRTMIGEGYKIVFCTGRPEKNRYITNLWISKYLHLLPENIDMMMRPDDDRRHDREIKPPMLRMRGITPDKVFFILEDRNSMVAEWRRLGYRVLQVREGDF